MERLPHANIVLALLRDDFHPDSVEGSVGLRDGDTLVLDCRVTDYTWDGIRCAFHAVAEIQSTAGAREMRPVHGNARSTRNLQGTRRIIDDLCLKTYRTRLGSTHVVGSCAMSENSAVAVASSLDRHHHLRNLSIHDGSLFPASIDANPQLSIYGLTA